MSDLETWFWRIGLFILGCLIWRFFANIARIAAALEARNETKEPTP